MSAVRVGSSVARPGDLPDPERLPVRYQSPATADGRPGASIVLDRRQATIRRQIAGAPMTLVMPIGAFRGVVAALDGDSDAVTVEIRHADPGLTIPLGRSADVAAAAAACRRWADVLGLPLLLADPDGTLVELDPAPEPKPAAVPSAVPAPSVAVAPPEGTAGILRAVVVNRDGRTTVVPQ